MNSVDLRREAIEVSLCLADLSLQKEGWLQHVGVSELMPPEAVYDLVVDAWTAVHDLFKVYEPWLYLEAASLLADGWSPGDAVEVRR